MKIRILLAAAIAAIALHSPARTRSAMFETDSTFFTTAEAARIGDQIIAYQRVTGGWPKNIDMASYLTAAELDAVVSMKNRRNDSTTDNDATSTQLYFLARLYKAQPCSKWRSSFTKGIEYLLSGQYPNGGWPQFWPENRGYQKHITYNDGAMVNTLSIIRDVRDGKAPFDTDGLIDEAMRARLDTAFSRGIDCILATQIVVDGEPTVWCQQHDCETLAPAPARAFELASFCSTESVGIVWLLMDIPNPDSRVRRAVEGAMRWFDRTRIDGYRYERRGPNGTRLVADSASSVWARYYDLETMRPFVCDRDGIPRERLEDIGRERRDGYSWYASFAGALYGRYKQWKEAIQDPER
ncbi:MAG: pectate lyase [Muribaculaceae bacterium]|nr:pectate lyase [Muribaculaceae bacterium]